ncbi:MAG TPA: hypothetical protein VMC09_14475 [Anaerolineales bacterium]|nr:hypothetical protein [Anaerolineales bacterium]
MRLTIRQLFVFLLFIGIFLMTLRPIADPDFWWHLRTGELIVQTRAIPHIDPFSFTKTGTPWVAHEWLTELIIYGLYRLGGYALLILVFSIVITGAFLLTYLRTPSPARPYIAGFCLLLGALSTAPTWGVRPQMLSLLITSIFLYFLDVYIKQQKIKTLIWLPLITVVWVNLHAGYLLGLAVVAIYIAGWAIDILRTLIVEKRGPYKQELYPILNLCAALALCIPAALANPNGYRILLYPFETLTSPSMAQFIQEWFSPDFHQIIWQPLAVLILALIGAGMLGRKSLSPTKILLVVAFGYLALRSMRNVPLFAIVAAPVLAEQIDSLIHLSAGTGELPRPIRWFAGALLVLVLMITGLRFIQVARQQIKTEADAYPKQAVDWIAQNKPAGNLYDTYAWGGYLIWRLYPDYRVFIDGRADVYGDKFIYDYINIYRGQPGWDASLAAAEVNLVLIEPDSGLANAIEQSSGWRIAYQDKLSIVFERIP